MKNVSDLFTELKVVSLHCLNKKLNYVCVYTIIVSILLIYLISGI